MRVKAWGSRALLLIDHAPSHTNCQYFEYCPCYLPYVSLSPLVPTEKRRLSYSSLWLTVSSTMIRLQGKLPKDTNNTIWSSSTENVWTGEFHLFSNTKARKNVYKLKRDIIQSMWSRWALRHRGGDVVDPGEPRVRCYRQNPHSGHMLGLGKVPGPFLT